MRGSQITTVKNRGRGYCVLYLRHSAQVRHRNPHLHPRPLVSYRSNRRHHRHWLSRLQMEEAAS